MFDNRDPVADAVQVQRIDPLHKALLAFGLVAPAVTFAIAVSALTIGQKTAILVSLAAVYAGICGTFIIRHRARAEAHRLEPETPDTMADDEIRDRLDALEEANEFFGSSLKAEDMFRLVASRVDEIFPFAAAMLLYPDGSAGELKTTYLTGKNEASLAETAAGITSGIAGISLASGNIEIDAELSAEKNARGEKPLEGFRSAAAIPLFHDGRPFAVFQLYSDRRITPDDETISLLDAVGERIAPIFVSSRSLERSIANALTDPLTDLPNERALFMVLENQLAESHRYRDERPLSLLAIDLKGFDEINQRFGHATGDNMLRHAGETIRHGLRKMDFLARSYNDEFIVVLPTASEKMAAEIMERIRELFVEFPFEVSEHEHVKLWLNFGSATFWKDGESGNQLIQAARLRKQQAKLKEPGNVLWFGREYVN